jgi:hypothetical protein
MISGGHGLNPYALQGVIIVMRNTLELSPGPGLHQVQEN